MTRSEDGDRGSGHEARHRPGAAPERAHGPAPEDAALPTRGGPKLLLDRLFGLYFAGRIVSMVGFWIYNIAAAIAVFERTGSAFLVGLVSVAQFSPHLVLTPWFGARADRRDRLRQMGLGLVVQLTAMFALTGFLLVTDVSNGFPFILTSAFVGIGGALSAPSMQALLPALVRPSELATAVAMNSIPATLARAAGPAFGALIVTQQSDVGAFATAAVCVSLFALTTLALKPPAQRMASATQDRRVRAGLQYIRKHPAAARLLVGVGAIGTAADPVLTLTPAIAARLVGETSLVGPLASMFGVGSGLAFLILGTVRRWIGNARLGPGGLMLLAVAPAGWAVGGSAGAALTAGFFGGVGMTFALTALTTLLQQGVPDELRGRIMALWAVAFLGVRPLVASISGWVADQVSLTGTLALIAGLTVAGACVVRPSRTELQFRT